MGIDINKVTSILQTLYNDFYSENSLYSIENKIQFSSLIEQNFYEDEIVKNLLQLAIRENIAYEALNPNDLDDNSFSIKYNKLINDFVAKHLLSETVVDLILSFQNAYILSTCSTKQPEVDGLWGEWIDEHGVVYSVDKTRLIRLNQAVVDYVVNPNCKIICDSAFTGFSYLERVELPPSVTHIGERAFCQQYNLKSVKFSSNLNFLGRSSFSECRSLQEVVLPDSLVSIEEDVFSNCDSLAIVKLPENLTKLPSGFCNECSSLQNVILGKNLLNIGDNVFSYCPSLVEIDLPNSILCIGNESFKECVKLRQINMPYELKHLGDMVFAGCSSLESIYINHNIDKIGDKVFLGCDMLVSIDVESPDYQSIDGVLYNTKRRELIHYPSSKYLRHFSIPDHIEHINSYAFYNQRYLESVNISSSLKYISESCFEKCVNLHRVKLHDDITYLDSFSFSNCKSLRVIELPKSLSSVGEWGAFQGCDNLQLFLVPKGETDFYKKFLHIEQQVYLAEQ